MLQQFFQVTSIDISPKILCRKSYVHCFWNCSMSALKNKNDMNQPRDENLKNKNKKPPGTLFQKSCMDFFEYGILKISSMIFSEILHGLRENFRHDFSKNFSKDFYYKFLQRLLKICKDFSRNPSMNFLRNSSMNSLRITTGIFQ